MRCYPSYSSPWSRLGYFLLLALTTDLVVADDGDTVPAKVDNFVRAETAMQFDQIGRTLRRAGEQRSLPAPAPDHPMVNLDLRSDLAFVYKWLTRATACIIRKVKTGEVWRVLASAEFIAK